MSSTIGTLFKVTTFGESHGEGVGCVIDGCPAGLLFDYDYIKSYLKKRRPSAFFSKGKNKSKAFYYAGNRRCYEENGKKCLGGKYEFYYRNFI